MAKDKNYNIGFIKDKPESFSEALRELTVSYNSAFKSITDNYVYSESQLGYNTIQKMLRDGTIASCLRDIKNLIFAKGYEILPAVSESNKDYEQHKTVRDFVDYAFEKGRDDSTESSIKSMLFSAIINEVSITELNYQAKETEDYGVKILWKNWKTRLTEQLNDEFNIKEDSHGNVTAIEQQTENINLSKILLYKFDDSENSSTYSINSEFDKLYRYWYAKHVILNLQHIHTELLSKISYYLSGPLPKKGSEEAKALKEFLRNFAKGGRGLLPEKMEAKVVQLTSSGKSNEYQSAIDYLDSQMRMILGKPESADKSGTNGSYNADSSRLSAFYLYLQSIQKSLQKAINEAIKRLVNINYVVSKYPEFSFNDIYEEDSETILKKLDFAIKNNVIDRVKENSKIRDKIGLWQSDEDLGDINNFKNEESETEINDNSNDEPEETETQMTDTKILVDKVDQPNWNKPKFLTDGQIATTKNKIILAESGGTIRISEVINKQVEWLKDYKRVAKILNANGKDASVMIESLKLPYVAELRNKFYSENNNFYKEMKKQGKTELEMQVKKLIDFEITEEATKQVQSSLWGLAQKNTDLLDNQILKIFKQNIISGMMYGKTEKDVVYNTIQQVERAGLTDFQVQALVRTSSTDSMNFAFQQTATSSGAMGYEYTAILDERTTGQCRAYDGMILKIGDPRISQIMPSNHYNCRSRFIAILIQNELNKAIQEVGGNDKINTRLLSGLAQTPVEFGGSKQSNTRIIA